MAREKEEYIWRFRILKKKYKHPSYEIPSYNEHSDLATMKITYDRTVRELYLDSTVEQYRTYLMGGFLAVEYVCNQWLGIDLEGFTKQQLKLMHKYDMLLVELGEKSYERFIFENGGFFEIMTESPVALNAHFVHEEQAYKFSVALKTSLKQILPQSKIIDMFLESIKVETEADESLTVHKWHSMKNIRKNG